MSRRSDRGTVKLEPALEKLGTGRAGAVQVMREVKIGSPVYREASNVADAIDDLTERLTSDRTHFHAKPASTAPKE
ncbi:hypothetical protein ABVF61_00370 [Roseibium sp. HPY-6]|uniref:hypothetical protein n=1 Tax=Roseibium sp. HPY-6 TaxID=3229852 RepID=UPI00338EB1E6